MDKLTMRYGIAPARVRRSRISWAFSVAVAVVLATSSAACARRQVLIVKVSPATPTLGDEVKADVVMRVPDATPPWELACEYVGLYETLRSIDPTFYEGLLSDRLSGLTNLTKRPIEIDGVRRAADQDGEEYCKRVAAKRGIATPEAQPAPVSEQATPFGEPAEPSRASRRAEEIDPLVAHTGPSADQLRRRLDEIWNTTVPWGSLSTLPEGDDRFVLRVYQGDWSLATGRNLGTQPEADFTLRWRDKTVGDSTLVQITGDNDGIYVGNIAIERLRGRCQVNCPEIQYYRYNGPDVLGRVNIRYGYLGTDGADDFVLSVDGLNFFFRPERNEAVLGENSTWEYGPMWGLSFDYFAAWNTGDRDIRELGRPGLSVSLGYGAFRTRRFETGYESIFVGQTGLAGRLQAGIREGVDGGFEAHGLASVELHLDDLWPALPTLYAGAGAVARADGWHPQVTGGLMFNDYPHQGSLVIAASGLLLRGFLYAWFALSPPD